MYMCMYIWEGHPEQGAASQHLHLYCQAPEEVLCCSTNLIYFAILQIHYMCEGNIGLFYCTMYLTASSASILHPKHPISL